MYKEKIIIKFQISFSRYFRMLFTCPCVGKCCLEHLLAVTSVKGAIIHRGTTKSDVFVEFSALAYLPNSIKKIHP